MSWLLGLVGGFVASLLLERCIAPCAPSLRRSLPAWCVCWALWSVLYGALYFLTGRLIVSLGLGLGFMALVVMVSNAKFASLREPFTYQDFRYLTDAMRYPRLYLPFLGLGKGLLLLIGALVALGLALWAEPPATDSAWLLRVMSGATASCGLLLLLILHFKWRPALSFDPVDDINHFGFWASMWLYRRALATFPTVESPFTCANKPEVLPNLVAVQSESFFDPRPLFSGIRANVLGNFDQLVSDALMSGRFKVPAWGANTVRSEFAFLSGLDETHLGAHRFNAYASILKGWRVGGLAGYLKALGYRTVCVHPYAASFYARERVFPLFGFDEFIDIRAFDGAERNGAYVSDAALTNKVLEVLKAHEGPTFIFVITMENHGPLHLEKVAESDIAALYNQPPPAGCEDLTVYLRHLRNADQMLWRLCEGLAEGSSAGGRPGSLCWYGDHVPIMPEVYKQLGYPEQASSYLIWDSRESYKARKVKSLAAHELAIEWVACCFNKYD